MPISFELSFRGVQEGNWVNEYVERQVERLERYGGKIITCRIAIERPQQHQRQGNSYRVRIELTLPPNHNVVAVKGPEGEQVHTDLRSMIRSAFDAAERQIKKLNAARRGDVKSHSEEPRAVVVRIFPDRGFGFLRDLEGIEYYFDRNSVLHRDFDRLAIGTEVRFADEQGDDGPQASTVQIVNKPGARETGAGRDDIPRGWR